MASTASVSPSATHLTSARLKPKPTPARSLPCILYSCAVRAWSIRHLSLAIARMNRVRNCPICKRKMLKFANYRFSLLSGISVLRSVPLCQLQVTITTSIRELTRVGYIIRPGRKMSSSQSRLHLADLARFNLSLFILPSQKFNGIVQ